MLFKCKMCGGDLEIIEDSTVAVCEYCGSKQTLPRLSDDRKRNMYDRANHFRRNNAYDKAMSIYENILNEDTTDAEAYWSLILCKYGIEYVEDPRTSRRFPTCNRTHYTSVLADEDYKAAIRYADDRQKEIYEAEAREIDAIQKNILEISRKEEPFDIFICYKESDRSGKRTPDSVIAQDMYYQLVQEGYKVFFSRITLENKLGTAYEPYIFAALNSAKVMIVVATKREYINAVWVENEWSRFLGMAADNPDKMLIPAYRDMDPYDLPEEFSHLQALDMSKIGFMQDLIHGIKKIVKEERESDSSDDETPARNAAVNVAPLLERVYLFLEDGDWENANIYCEKVLDAEPKNARAYLGKLMAELEVSKAEKLIDCPEPFDGRKNYQKTIRFADERLRHTLEQCVASIKSRNEQERSERIYADSVSKMEQAQNEDEYRAAAGGFGSISGYRDANVLMEQCRELAESVRKDNVLKKARLKEEDILIQSLIGALASLGTIQGWKEADQIASEYRVKLENLKAQEERKRIEREQQEEQRRLLQERRERGKELAFRFIVIAVFAGVAFAFLWKNII